MSRRPHRLGLESHPDMQADDVPLTKRLAIRTSADFLASPSIERNACKGGLGDSRNSLLIYQDTTINLSPVKILYEVGIGRRAIHALREESRGRMDYGIPGQKDSQTH
jgi:hypothetical protein